MCRRGAAGESSNPADDPSDASVLSGQRASVLAVCH